MYLVHRYKNCHKALIRDSRELLKTADFDRQLMQMTDEGIFPILLTRAFKLISLLENISETKGTSLCGL